MERAKGEEGGGGEGVGETSSSAAFKPALLLRTIVVAPFQTSATTKWGPLVVAVLSKPALLLKL